MLFRSTEGCIVVTRHSTEGHRRVLVSGREVDSGDNAPTSFYFYGDQLRAKVWEQEQLGDFHEPGMGLLIKTQGRTLCSSGRVTCLDYGSVG